MSQLHHHLHKTRQSPIDINTKHLLNQKANPLTLRFNPGDCVEVEVKENGSFKVLARTHSTSSIGGPHLSPGYRLHHFHAHWGGSEHSVDGKHYDAEIHFVYWNTRYHIVEEAFKKGDGIAVLAVFVEKGKANEEFENLLTLIEEAHRRHRHVRVPLTFHPNALLPKGATHRYFTYLGGLTTPPFTECVVWTILQKPITFSEGQLERLSRLTSFNCRHSQKLYDRNVVACT